MKLVVMGPGKYFPLAGEDHLFEPFSEFHRQNMIETLEWQRSRVGIHGYTMERYLDMEFNFLINGSWHDRPIHTTPRHRKKK